jgi:hypothetical protein
VKTHKPIGLRVGLGAACLALPVLVGWLAAGPAAPVAPGGGDETPEPAVKFYVGTIQGAPASARIALVVEGGAAVTYVCSEDAAFNTGASRWLQAKAGAGDTLDATSPDGVRLQATVTADACKGKLTTKGGDTLTFVAGRVSSGGGAGLYRLEEMEGGDLVVSGMICDADGFLVGVKSKKGTPVQVIDAKKTLEQNGGLVQKQENGKVKQADATKGKSIKMTAAALQARLQRSIATLQSRGGSPLQALVLGSLRRQLDAAKGTIELSDVKAATELDAKLFPILARMGKKNAQKLVDGWDALPQAGKKTMLGNAEVVSQLKANVSKQQIANLLGKRLIGKQTKLMDPLTAKRTFSTVQIRKLHCIDPTDPNFLGNDEIFAIYVVTAGPFISNPQQTSVINGMNVGKTALFSAKDAAVFPPAGQANQVPPTGPIEISAALFEDDTQEIAAIIGVLNAAAQAGVEIAKFVLPDKVGQDTSAVKQELDSFFTAVQNAIPATQYLGLDTLRINPDGSKVDAVTGQPRNFFRIASTKTGLFANEYEYRLEDIQVFK